MLLIVRRYIPWKLSLIFPLAYLALASINLANSSVNFLSGYSTTQSILNYSGIKTVSIISDLLVTYVSGVMLFALIFGLSRWLTGMNIGMIVTKEKLTSFRYWKDGLVLALFALLLTYCLNFIATLINHYFLDQTSYGVLTASVNSFFPGIGYTAGALKSALTNTMTSGIYLLLAILLWRKHRGLLGFLVALLLLQDINLAFNSDSSTLYASIVNISISIIKLAVFLMLFRFNVIAYLLFYYYQSMITYALIMTDTAWPVYGFDTSIVYIALLLPIIGIVLLSRKPGQHAI